MGFWEILAFNRCEEKSCTIVMYFLFQYPNFENFFFENIKVFLNMLLLNVNPRAFDDCDNKNL